MRADGPGGAHNDISLKYEDASGSQKPINPWLPDSEIDSGA